MSRRRWLLPACVGLLLLGRATASGGGSVRDMVGRWVDVPDLPRRVVSLAPSLTETVFAVGAGDRLVGVTDYCDYPAEARTKPTVGGMLAPSVERILALRPDLILVTTEGNAETDVRGLERLHLPVYVVGTTDFVTVLDSIERLGRLLGRADEADRLAIAMRREAERIARAVQGVPRRRVLYVVWGNPLIVPGRDTLITDLIRRAGGVSVSESERIPYPEFSWEAALVQRPERVIVTRRGPIVPGPTAAEAVVREWPQLALVPAVRQGQLYVIDEAVLHRPGPRIVDGLRALTRVLHPEVALGTGGRQDQVALP